MMEILDKLSDHLNAGLRRAGYPRLTPLHVGLPGRIVVGERHEFDELTPPRIIFRPTDSSFSDRDNTRGTVRLSANQGRYDAESRKAIGNPGIHTESVTFEVAAWSLAPDGLRNSGASDFDFTRALYSQLIMSMNHLLSGCYKVERGTWRLVPHVNRPGREFVFGLSINMPVTTELEPLRLEGFPTPYDPETGLPSIAGADHAPAGTELVISDTMVLPDGTTGPGCETPDDDEP